MGFYNARLGHTQFHGKALGRRALEKFLVHHNPNYLICWGPDIGRLENEFELELKSSFKCINLMTACARLGYPKSLDAALKTLDCRTSKLRFQDGDEEICMDGRLAVAMWSQWEATGESKPRNIVLRYNQSDCGPSGLSGDG